MKWFSEGRALQWAKRGLAIMVLAATVATLLTPATSFADDGIAIAHVGIPATLPADAGENPIMP